MLSRVADTLHWMARYIARAGNLARMVDANSQLILDVASGADVESRALELWRPLLEVNALDESFDKACASGELHNVSEFLCIGETDGASIRQCIALARENARMVRDQISEEVWLELNTLHLYLKDEGPLEWRTRPQAFTERIIRFSLLFEGLANATIPHNEGWLFLQSGLYLERADKTSRMLDIPQRLPGVRRSTLPWGTVLSCCSAGTAYRELYGGPPNEQNTVSLLIFSDTFPRSVRFCLRRLDDTLRAISGTPKGQFSNEAERLTGSALASLDFAGPNEVAETGLQVYIDQIQTRLNEISQQIFETYVLLPSELEALNVFPSRFHAYQQQQAQQ